MGKVRVIRDKIGGTLTIWFGDPKEEYICTETGEDVILMKDKDGRVIGAEFLHYSSTSADFLVKAIDFKDDDKEAG